MARPIFIICVIFVILLAGYLFMNNVTSTSINFDNSSQEIILSAAKDFKEPPNKLVSDFPTTTDSPLNTATTATTIGIPEEDIQQPDLFTPTAEKHLKDVVEYEYKVHPDPPLVHVMPAPRPPPQAWVHNNVIKALKLLNYKDPTTTHWEEVPHLTCLKTYYSQAAAIVYTGIPKAGCTNWKYTILKQEPRFSGAVKTPSPKVHYIINRINLAGMMRKERLNDKFSFTVIRNPWTRMVSGYKDKLNSSSRISWKHGKVTLYILNNYRDSKITLPQIKDDALYPTFLEFLQYLVDEEISHINDHFKPQYSMLGLQDVKYDYVGALEHAKLQSNEILQHFKTWEHRDLSVPGPYDSTSDPRNERSTLYAKSWFNDIPQYIIDKLYKKYEPDFLIYNYSNFTHELFPFPIEN